MTSCTSPTQHCFVIMPFGVKVFAQSVSIDFDAVYARLIAPAIEAAGLAPLRADTEMYSGVIHKQMLEQILLCDYAVADMTLDNANVFWELGVRHGFYPAGTVLLRGNVPDLDRRVPFDLNFMKYHAYGLDAGGGLENPERDRALLAHALLHARENIVVDSPLYALIQGIKPPEIDRRKTDTLRLRFAENAAPFYQELNRAAERNDKGRALKKLVKTHPPASLDCAAQMAVYLALREQSLWQDMVNYYPRLSAPLRESVMAREQYALALNRHGGPGSRESRQAEVILQELIHSHGPSSETCALLGRVYKDRFDTAMRDGKKAEASAHLDKAIKAYVQGFEADSRDAYPGINAATLMEMRDNDARKTYRDLLPAVKWAARRRTANENADYWDFATLLEAAVLDEDWQAIPEAEGQALCAEHSLWMLESTVKNLCMIREVRQERNRDVRELNALITRLRDSLAAGGLTGGYAETALSTRRASGRTARLTDKAYHPLHSRSKT